MKKNPKDLEKAKEMFKDRYEERYNKDTISMCINIAEEYGRIATLIEEGVEEEHIDYEFIEYQFTRLYPYLEKTITNWEQLEYAYGKFLEDYY